MGHAADIEDECAACHAPAAQKIAHAAGGKAQLFAHVANVAAGTQSPLDDLAVDGVSCTVCHQIAPDRLGTRESFNGNFVVAPPRPDGRRRAFGPFEVDAGRRRLMDALGEPDPYCPIVRGEDRRLAIRQAAAREMPKLESACTTIVIARD